MAPLDNRHIRQQERKKKVELTNVKGTGRIRVCVRKRPIHSKETNDIVKAGVKECHITESKKRLDMSEYSESHCFRFDECFGEKEGNNHVYQRTASKLLQTFLSGGNASCIAYGQTGSGKTHTMMGDDDHEGLYIMAARDIFASAPISSKQYHINASLYEIYCEKLYDLMDSRKQVHAREGADGIVKICGLSEHRVQTASQMLKLVTESNRQRALGCTSANARSSRSHAILRLSLVNSQDQEISHFLFIDLAGSERGADTAASDKRTRREGSEINKSLLALKECIRGMDMGHKHIKFRGSKLTEVLRASFTGDCRTCMIVTVSPSQHDTEHTMNTLRYANRVKRLPAVKTTHVDRHIQKPTAPPAYQQGIRNVKSMHRRPQSAPTGGFRTQDLSSSSSSIQKLNRSNTTVEHPRRGWNVKLQRALQKVRCKHCGSYKHHHLLCRKPPTTIRSRRPRSARYKSKARQSLKLSAKISATKLAKKSAAKANKMDDKKKKIPWGMSNRGTYLRLSESGLVDALFRRIE